MELHSEIDAVPFGGHPPTASGFREVQNSAASESTLEVDGVLDCFEPEKDEDEPKEIKIPRHVDHLVAYSCAEGYVSYRSPEKGSIFIRALVEELENNRYTDEDLVTRLVRVSRKVSESNEIIGATQMPCITSSLSKKMPFPPFKMEEENFQASTTSLASKLSRNKNCRIM